MGDNQVIKSYRELVVWQKGIELVMEVYKVTGSFPGKEVFGLTSQMRRSCLSIPSNIAEGWMRQYAKEYIQYIYHALGSCGELYTQLTIAVKIGYIEERMVPALFDKIDHVSKMLRKIANKLSSR